jgi:hypothetical protein
LDESDDVNEDDVCSDVEVTAPAPAPAAAPHMGAARIATTEAQGEAGAFELLCSLGPCCNGWLLGCGETDAGDEVAAAEVADADVDADVARVGAL